MTITVLCIFVFLFKGLKKKSAVWDWSSLGFPDPGMGEGGRGVFWLCTSECGSSDGFLMDSHARPTSGYSPKKCIL